jgi:large subunit ribosomal protein L20
MPKAQNVGATRKRRKRTLRNAKGYFGNASRLYRYAKQATDRAGVYAYRDRRTRKREFRKLWIVRINAACRNNGMAYSRFIAGLNKAGIELDRKALSEMAIHDEAAFAALVKEAQDALSAS